MHASICVRLFFNSVFKIGFKTRDYVVFLCLTSMYLPFAFIVISLYIYIYIYIYIAQPCGASFINWSASVLHCIALGR